MAQPNELSKLRRYAGYTGKFTGGVGGAARAQRASQGDGSNRTFSLRVIWTMRDWWTTTSTVP